MSEAVMYLAVGVVVFVLVLGGLRFMEQGICQSYEGNTYDIIVGKCEWPPLREPKP